MAVKGRKWLVFVGLAAAALLALFLINVPQDGFLGLAEKKPTLEDLSELLVRVIKVREEIVVNPKISELKREEFLRRCDELIEKLEDKILVALKEGEKKTKPEEKWKILGEKPGKWIKYYMYDEDGGMAYKYKLKTSWEEFKWKNGKEGEYTEEYKELARLVRDGEKVILEDKDGKESSCWKTDMKQYGRYQLYVVESQRGGWQEISYLFDEWGAYLGGGNARLNLFKEGRRRDGSGNILSIINIVEGPADFLVIGTAAAKYLQQSDPEYFQDEQFQLFLKEMIEQTMELINEATRLMGRNGAGHTWDVLNGFRTSGDAASIRQMLKELYGEEWTRGVLGF